MNHLQPIIKQPVVQQQLHVVWCICGILGSLLLYGVLQERIMGEPFGDERFTFSLLLVFFNRLTTCAVAAAILVFKGLDSKPQAPIASYAAVSISNVIATTCQYEALRYLSFPLQTLGKTSKMVPNMLWGSLILHKRYKCQDYVLAIAITGGCALFGTSGSVAAKAADRTAMPHASTAGVALMVTYLAFDGFTSTWQDRLFRGTSMTIYNMSLHVTLCSTAIAAAGLVTSGQLLPAIAFIGRHPSIMASMLALSFAATIGQFFITYTIKCHGALLFATVMTSRQLLSILLSCFIFRHPLSLGQWVSTAVVFGALYMKTLKRPATKSVSASPASNQSIVETFDGKVSNRKIDVEKGFQRQ